MNGLKACTIISNLKSIKMKTIVEYCQRRSMILLSATIAILMGFSACKVVVEDYAAANVFGYNTSGVYDPKESYQINILDCETKLMPVKVDEVPGTGGVFFNTVSGQFTNADGWTFQSAAEELSSGALRVKTYDAQGTPTRVGCEIHMVYRPQGDDPTNIHWIQVINTNHSLKPPAGHGNSSTYVDIPNSATTHYYDDGYAANVTNLYDFPGRVDASNTHNWEATTFIATGPAIGTGAGNIVLYSPGFKWGWVNECKLIIDFPDWFFYLERIIVFQLNTELSPGGNIAMTSDGGANLVLSREDLKVPVKVKGMQLNLEVGDKIDAGGYYTLNVLDGQISLDGYDLNDERVEPFNAKIQAGSGYVHWETWEASLQMETQVAGPDGPINMVFTGTGQFDRRRNTFTLSTEIKGIEKSKIQ